MALLEIRGLTVSYPGQSRPALTGVDLSLEAGAFVTLCGRSGSGKSTLLRCCKPDLAPHGPQTGEILFQGVPLSRLDRRTQSGQIGYVGQSPAGQVVTDRVWRELAFGPESLGWEQDTIRRRVTEMASFFGIQHWFDRDIATLSGGQCQVLNLAAVMVLGPALVLLDEPTSQLDPIAAGHFLSLLTRLNQELGTTILLAEHRLEEAVPRSDRLAVLEDGRLLCQGPPEQVAAALRGHPLAAGLPAPMAVWTQVPNDLPCPVTVRQGQRWLAAYGADHPLASLPPEPIPLAGEVLLSGEDLWFRYDRAGPEVLKGLTLAVCRGEWTALLGGNGSGKTTALHLLAGCAAPQRGRCQGSPRTALLPQDPTTLLLHKTIRETLQAQLRDLGTPPADWETSLAAAADLCGLTDLLDRHPYDLSGGEQQRAALARVLLTQPEVLLLDEPTKGLDRPRQDQLAALLETLLARGVGVLMVSHDLDFCARHVHRCALLFDGAIVTEGTPRAFFSGNQFYTTAANRMARELLPQAVTPEEVAEACGGAAPGDGIASPSAAASVFSESPPVSREEKTVPVRRRRHWPVALGLVPVLALTLLAGQCWIDNFYVVALLLAAEALGASFLSFERRKPSAREVVLLAVLCALGVVSRAAFFFLPQIKPVTALTILAGVSLGGESGFLVGAVTMLVSNFLFGQGPWTPWQMVAMGLIGLLAGVLFRKRKGPVWLLCLFGFLAAVVVYGGVMNPASALLWTHQFQGKLVLTYCLAGLPMDLLHGASTAVLLWLLAEPFLAKLDRVQRKFGLDGQESVRHQKTE